MMTEHSCKEKPEVKGAEEGRSKRVLMLLIAALGLTMVVGGFLYLFFDGLPFGFVVPFVNLGSLADGLFFVVVVAAAVYIGVVGLRELVVERRFSVEFLRATFRTVRGELWRSFRVLCLIRLVCWLMVPRRM